MRVWGFRGTIWDQMRGEAREKSLYQVEGWNPATQLRKLNTSLDRRISGISGITLTTLISLGVDSSLDQHIWVQVCGFCGSSLVFASALILSRFQFNLSISPNFKNRSLRTLSLVVSIQPTHSSDRSIDHRFWHHRRDFLALDFWSALD